MENVIYELPKMALIAATAVILGTGVLLGISIPRAQRWFVNRKARIAEQELQALKNQLPVVTLSRQEARWAEEITSLLPQMRCEIFNEEGCSVGRISYVLSPIAECIYLFGIDIRQEFWRRGYATAALRELSQINSGLLITPVQEKNTEEALFFWKMMREIADTGFPVKKQISIGDYEFERRKWTHLHFQERLFEHVKFRHEKTFLDFQSGLYPMATDAKEIRDPEFLKDFEYRQ